MPERPTLDEACVGAVAKLEDPARHMGAAWPDTRPAACVPLIATDFH